MTTLTEQRRYRSDDRDLDGCDNDLLIFQGENGDWYVSIVKHGEKLGPCVRITTSGAPARQPLACVGARRLWDYLDLDLADPGAEHD
jgi:hypothetical protein